MKKSLFFILVTFGSLWFYNRSSIEETIIGSTWECNYNDSVSQNRVTTSYNQDGSFSQLSSLRITKPDDSSTAKINITQRGTWQVANREVILYIESQMIEPKNERGVELKSQLEEMLPNKFQNKVFIVNSRKYIESGLKQTVCLRQ